MKLVKIFSICISVQLFGSMVAAATPAQQFRGLYPLIEADGQAVVPNSEFLIVDADSLEVIWQRYTGEDLPPNLEQYRTEPSIIAGFTDRDFVILAFEAFSMVTQEYLRLTSGDEQRFELFRQGNGTVLLGTMANGSNNRYLTDLPQPLPPNKLRVDSPLLIKLPVQNYSEIDYK